MAPRDARPILIDVTRLVSRVGAGPLTGIDRVERALLLGLLSRDCDLHGLCRTVPGFALLSRNGLQSLARRIAGTEPWGSADAVGFLSLKLPRARRAAEGTIRRLAAARARSSGLGSLLAERLPPGIVYFNVGHANLSPAALSAVRSIPSARVVVMVHDVIPLRAPWTQRPEAALRFAEKLDAVARHADVVICPSLAESHHLRSALLPADPAPALVVIPPGIDVVAPSPHAGLPRSPYFVAVGTLEPRKNIGLLLDVWDHLASTRSPDAIPGLVLIGRRGWESAAFFRRLDTMKARRPEVEEHPDLPDAARAALVAGARALLFPSLAEGYGLPPLEALALGTAPVCAPLPVYRETMGDAAVYAGGMDLYHWSGIVGDLAASKGLPSMKDGWEPPSWDGFVNAVLATSA
jgi:glycosyltransferase involved in cell wall biosynthesis